MSKIPDIQFENDENEMITLKCIYTVCPRCNGTGAITNPNIDGHGITDEEFRADPDFKRDYMRGVYDIECPECKGLRVVPTPSTFLNSDEDLAAWERHILDEAAYEAELAMERRMGC